MYFALLFFSFPADFFSNGQLFSADFFFRASFIVWICPPRPASKLAVWRQVQTGELYSLDLSPTASFRAGREETSRPCARARARARRARAAAHSGRLCRSRPEEKNKLTMTTKAGRKHGSKAKRRAHTASFPSWPVWGVSMMPV